MNRRIQPANPPRFFWQGVLILLPVVVLAGAGFYSMSEDKRLARQEATVKAQALADEMARVLWNELTDPANLGRFTNHTFRVDASGRLVFPPPAPELPVPQPLDLSGLDEAQRRLWRAANEPDQTTNLTAIAACRQLLESNLPTNLAANVTFRLGVLLANAGQTNEAVAAFGSVVARFPDARSDSGLPLEPLARFRVMELNSRLGAGASNTNLAVFDASCSNLVSRPTFLTPSLLTRAAGMEWTVTLTNVIERWQVEWERQDALRVLAEPALRRLEVKQGPVTATVRSPSHAANEPTAVPALFWFQAPDLSPTPQTSFALILGSLVPLEKTTRSMNIVDSVDIAGSNHRTESSVRGIPETSEYFSALPREWLASRLGDGRGGYWIVCRAMDLVRGGEVHSTLRRGSREEVFRALPPLPDWFGASLDIAGVSVDLSNGLGIVDYRAPGKGGGQTWGRVASEFAPEILASATRVENGTEMLRINIYLVSPDKLFAAQRARSRLFGLLIAAASLTAVIGFVSAWRAFQRQQRLAEMKTNFVSSVSHELRAPIASVRLMAESLERGKVQEPAKQREYFGFIGQECRRLSSLIENVLDFARIEQGRKQYEFEPTDLRRLIEETVKRFEPQATERGIRLVTQLSTLNPQPSVDGRAIQQALINLLDNALKHSLDGGEVTVGLECGDLSPLSPVGDSSPTAMRPVASQQSADKSAHSKGVLRLFIQDHGPGIPPEEHEKIFERFYRRGSELRRETQGVGIGLSIVKHIAEAHGGRVTVRSDVGKGSRFTIVLPMDGRKTLTS